MRTSNSTESSQETSEFVSTRSVSPGASVLSLGVRPVGTCGACCCGGEGCCYTTITGPGTAWVQSMPWELYRRHMGVVVQLDKNGNVKGVS